MGGTVRMTQKAHQMTRILPALGMAVVIVLLLALGLRTPGPAPALPGGLAAPHHDLAELALPAGQAVLERALAPTAPDGLPPEGIAPIRQSPPARTRRASTGGSRPLTRRRHVTATPRAPPSCPA
jgi:hypothetical protein